MLLTDLEDSSERPQPGPARGRNRLGAFQTSYPLHAGNKEPLMHRFTRFASALAVFGLVLATFGFTANNHQPARKDIVDTAVGAGQFKTLAAALKAGGLVETLKGEGPFTVFAPTDDAFAKLPDGTLDDLLKPENKEKLVAILTYHVVAGQATSSDVAGMKSAKTVNGKEVKFTVKDGKVMVNNANVIKADVMASNGVIHVVDTVLLP
jgi:uncharacterized surface protein with fasciclin (FAS1) repeats